MQGSGMMASEAVVEDLVNLVRTEVTAAIKGGVNWKLVINGAGASDVGYIMERHGKVRGSAGVKPVGAGGSGQR
jgi:hypothetical protein